MKMNTENMMKNQGLAHSKSLKKIMVAAAAITGSVGASQAFTTANLLVDPNFETQATTPSFGTVVSSFPTYQGLWGDENGSFVGTTAGVSPLISRMHSIQGNPSWGQTIQIISLADYATEIAAGQASFDMSALYNVSTGVDGALAGIAVRFFSSDWNSRFGNTSSTLVLDDTANTWEEISHSGAIPTNAAWIGTEVLYNMDSLGGAPGFVDEASLTITTVPEPSSALLFTLAGLGLVCRRKRS